MFCQGLIAALHLGQWEAGKARPSFSAGASFGCSNSSQHCSRQDASIILGRRRMTTLKKLPRVKLKMAVIKYTNHALSFAVIDKIDILYTTCPSWKIGRYIAIIKPPTSTPSIDIIMGSISEDRESTLLSTSSS